MSNSLDPDGWKMFAKLGYQQMTEVTIIAGL